MYRQLNNLAPVPIVVELVLNRTVHRYKTRGSGNVHAQYRRTQKVANSFLNTSPYYWNSPPPPHPISLQVFLLQPLISGIKDTYLIIPWPNVNV